MENYLDAVEGYIQRAQARRASIEQQVEQMNAVSGYGGGFKGTPQGKSNDGRGSGGILRGGGTGHAVMPIKGSGFTAGSAGDFGPRVNPYTHEAGTHTGYDFSASSGTPIRAAVGGTVVSAGWDPIYGWQTIIKTKNGFTTQYGHQIRDPKKLHAGMHIKAGQVIGRVGATGYATGPHLHFGVENRKGNWIDPMKWLEKILKAY